MCLLLLAIMFLGSLALVTIPFSIMTDGAIRSGPKPCVLAAPSAPHAKVDSKWI